MLLNKLLFFSTTGSWIVIALLAALLFYVGREALWDSNCILISRFGWKQIGLFNFVASRESFFVLLGFVATSMIQTYLAYRLLLRL